MLFKLLHAVFLIQGVGRGNVRFPIRCVNIAGFVSSNPLRSHSSDFAGSGSHLFSSHPPRISGRSSRSVPEHDGGGWANPPSASPLFWTVLVQPWQWWKSAGVQLQGGAAPPTPPPSQLCLRGFSEFAAGPGT